jgi:hypothetical protein
VNNKKSKRPFRSLFAEKLMDLGNIIVAALVLSQFVSAQKFSFLLFTLGLIMAIIFYVISYYVIK